VSRHFGTGHKHPTQEKSSFWSFIFLSLFLDQRNFYYKFSLNIQFEECLTYLFSLNNAGSNEVATEATVNKIIIIRSQIIIS